MKYDRELVYLSSLLHDLGLSEEHAADKRFDVDGADAAHTYDYPKAKADIVWDAIALHTAADIADRTEPEVALVHFGASSTSWDFGWTKSRLDRQYDRALPAARLQESLYEDAHRASGRRP